MELYQLRSFVAVAGERHLTRASVKLNISQPAVSAHIKALEQEFGLPLFTRTPSGMELTSKGKQLAERAAAILEQVEAMKQLGMQLQGQPTGSIRIGLNRHAEFLRITPLYQQLQTRYPGIDVILNQSISGTILKQIRAGELDCGFILGGCEKSDITVIRLAGYRLRVVGPVAFQERLEMADLAGLAGFPWIGFPADCPYSPIIEQYFIARGLHLKTGVIADQQSAIISMIESGVGLSLMLEEEAFAARERQQIALWPGGSFPIDLSFVHRSADKKSATLQAVLDVITSIWSNDRSGATAEDA